MSGHFYNEVSKSKFDWKSATLVLPCVAVGNVAQLAVDLLVNTLLKNKSCHLVGRISSSSLRPVVGPNAFDLFSANTMTSCEVYESEQYKLVIVQLRSPTFKGQTEKFVATLVEWMKTSSFNRVVILSSSFSQYLSTADPMNERNPVRYLSANDIAGLQRIVPVEEYSLKPNDNGVIHIPGSGMAKKLYSSCLENGLNVQLLVKYCSEGDNTHDAFSFVNTLNDVIKVGQGIKWEAPISWNKLFGNDYPTTLF